MVPNRKKVVWDCYGDCFFSTFHISSLFVFVVLDMSRHIPLYKALLTLLKAFATCKYTIRLIVSMHGQTTYDKNKTVFALVTKLKDCVQTYQEKLR